MLLLGTSGFLLLFFFFLFFFFKFNNLIILWVSKVWQIFSFSFRIYKNNEFIQIFPNFFCLYSAKILPPPPKPPKAGTGECLGGGLFVCVVPKQQLSCDH
jgi:hypothetical protein